jgi:SnoaL-like domain
MSAEERVRRLEDREAIRRLLFEYRRRLDEKDIRGYAELFAAEGEFIAGEMRAKGPNAIFELVDGMRGTLLTERGGDDVHVVANPVIELDVDRATAESNWLYIVRGEDGGPVLSKLGCYRDVLTREEGRWRFLRREAPTEIPAL